jgi:amidophosphoribosyltransferase
MKKVREECGVFGIWGAKKKDAARLTYYALFALQHRGQESCGIAVCKTAEKGAKPKSHRAVGLVPEVFTAEQLEKLGNAQCAVGHVRYSAAGSGDVEYAQPLVVRHMQGSMAVAHNGNIANARALRRPEGKQGL